MERGAFVGRPDPGPFHCLSCKTYVTGTESGHCPRCGWVPPSAPPIVEPRAPTGSFLLVLVLVLVLALLALVAQL